MLFLYTIYGSHASCIFLKQPQCHWPFHSNKSRYEFSLLFHSLSFQKFGTLVRTINSTLKIFRIFRGSMSLYKSFLIFHLNRPIQVVVVFSYRHKS